MDLFNKNFKQVCGIPAHTYFVS